MSYLLKQAQTAQPLVFLLVDETDHIGGLTGAAPTVTLSKNGGAFAAASGAVTELGSGWYAVAANATDADTLGPLLLHAEAIGADPVDDRYDVVAFDPQSATSLGLANLDVAISTRLAAASYAAPPSEAAITTAVWANATRTLTSTAAPDADAIADAVLSRSVATVEATAAEFSMCTVILALTNSSVSGNAWNVLRTDGVTVHRTRPIPSSARAIDVTAR